MKQVAGPVVAIALVLVSVFVPVSFLGGLTGQFYRQFALTLAVSVAISLIVALTLTPALCALLLRPTDESHFGGLLGRAAIGGHDLRKLGVGRRRRRGRGRRLGQRHQREDRQAHKHHKQRGLHARPHRPQRPHCVAKASLAPRGRRSA